MANNFLSASLRNIRRNRAFAAVNVVGLALGMASFVTVLLFFHFELSYDKWDPSLRRVYRVSERSDEQYLERTPAPLAALLRQDLPDVESATSIISYGNFGMLLAGNDKKLYVKGGVESDSLFFRVFPYRIIEGDVRNPLGNLSSIVLSEELAKTLFGSADPIGKTVRIYNAFDCEVTAVMQVPMQPSHLDVAFVLRPPYDNSNRFWGNQSYTTYIKTTGLVTSSIIEREVDRLYYENRLKKNGQSYEAFHRDGHVAGLFAEAVGNIHSFPRHGNGNFSTVFSLLLLAILLLVAGAVNFSNLSLATSFRRAKEVGVRKVLGSDRWKLVLQFMAEAGLQCLISLALAFVLVGWLLPYLRTEFHIPDGELPWSNLLMVIPEIAGCLVAVIGIAGLYPAIFLARFNVTKVLKGDYSRGTRGIAFRNSLIVVQFVVSAFFVILAVVISSQVRYMERAVLVSSGDEIMRIAASQDTRDNRFETVRQTLLRIPGVEEVAKTTRVPGDASGLQDTSLIDFRYQGRQLRMNSVKISDGYFRALHIGLVTGRLFDTRAVDQGTRTAVINETAANLLGLKDPVGATLSFPYCDSVPVRIVGVVADMHVSALERLIQPEVYTIGNKACRYQSGGAILVRLQADRMAEALPAVQAAWKTVEPAFPIRYSFLDENFQQLFENYAHEERIVGGFSLVAILISLMGLFALSTYLVRQRVREIAIRKVLGANARDIGWLVSRDFLRLVFLSVLITLPLGWWAASEWLQQFAYRISLSWWVFGLASVAILLLAQFTVSLQALRAAMGNPATSMRTE